MWVGGGREEVCGGFWGKGRVFVIVMEVDIGRFDNGYLLCGGWIVDNLLWFVFFF